MVSTGSADAPGDEGAFVSPGSFSGTVSPGSGSRDSERASGCLDAGFVSTASCRTFRGGKLDPEGGGVNDPAEVAGCRASRGVAGPSAPVDLASAEGVGESYRDRAPSMRARSPGCPPSFGRIGALDSSGWEFHSSSGRLFV